MHRNTICLIWLAGIILALLVYSIGPDRFMTVVSNLFVYALDDLDDLLRLLSTASFDLIRSTAIAIFVVFLTLASFAVRRGLRARGSLIVISALFLILTETGHPGSSTRWATALLLVVIGALTMTRRLMQTPPVIGLR